MAVARLDPPGWLPGMGKRIFRELAAVLYEAGVTTKGDRLALALLAKNYADYRAADAKVAEQGETISCGVGSRKLNPYVHLRSAAEERILKGLATFGLTPADRARVTRAAGDPEADLRHLVDRALKRKKG